MECPGCHQSYCLSCEASVDPGLYRCEPGCRQEHDDMDPFAQSARQAETEVARLTAALEELQKNADGNQFWTTSKIRRFIDRILAEAKPRI